MRHGSVAGAIVVPVASPDARDDADGPPPGPAVKAVPPERISARAVRRARAVAEDARRRTPPPLLNLLVRCVRAVTGIEPFDRAMVLAAQAFTGIFPLIIALAALVPGNTNSLLDEISSALGVPEGSRDALQQALPPEPDTRGFIGLLGVFVAVFSATSFSRALARMYGKVWGVRPPGWGSAWRWVATVLGIMLLTLGLRALYLLTQGLYATLGQILVALVVNGVLWTWVPWLLLAGQVRWRLLVPGAALMGLGSALLSLASGLYLPRALLSASRHYGALGVAFTYIGWLFVVSFVLVGSTVIGEVLAREKSLVRFLGSAPSEPRTPPR
jgi:membrane protein